MKPSSSFCSNDGTNNKLLERTFKNFNFLANKIDIFKTKLPWLPKFYLIENKYMFINIVDMLLHLPFV